ncbi:MAG: hypothetical protein RCG15_00215 [Candidatus Rickettsia vulgarisii]
MNANNQLLAIVTIDDNIVGHVLGKSYVQAIGVSNNSTLTFDSDCNYAYGILGISFSGPNQMTPTNGIIKFVNNAPATMTFSNASIPPNTLPPGFPQKIGTLEIVGSDLKLVGNMTGENLFFKNIRFSNVVSPSKLTLDPSMKLRWNKR